MIGYVTVEEADTYVEQYYISEDSLREEWDALDTDDKEALLRKSFANIETLPFLGRKTDPTQENAFPRNGKTDVPWQIKHAQVENALTMADTQNAEDMAFYQKLWQYGVESYKIGNLSERTSKGTWGTHITQGIVSNKATRLLLPFVNGGFQIR